MACTRDWTLPAPARVSAVLFASRPTIKGLLAAARLPTLTMYQIKKAEYTHKAAHIRASTQLVETES